MKNGYHFPVSLLFKKNSHSHKPTHKSKQSCELFPPNNKKKSTEMYIFLPRKRKKSTFELSQTHANLSFWRSESLLKFNAIGRASTKSLRSMQTVGKSGKKKKRIKHYTQTMCSALLSDPCTTFEHDVAWKVRALTQIHNQSTDTVKQWVFVSLQYTFRKEGTESRRKIAGLFCWNYIRRVRAN